MPKYTVNFQLCDYWWEVEADNEDEAYAKAAKEFENYIENYGIEDISIGYRIDEGWTEEKRYEEQRKERLDATTT